MKNWIIRYYVSETAYRVGAAALTETARGSKNFAVCRARNKIKYSKYMYYEVLEK